MKKAFFIIAAIAILAIVGSFYYFGGPYESLVTRLVLAVIGAPLITALIVIFMFIPGSREKQKSEEELRREAAWKRHGREMGYDYDDDRPPQHHFNLFPNPLLDDMKEENRRRRKR